jgi:hypothetical protein
MMSGRGATLWTNLGCGKFAEDSLIYSGIIENRQSSMMLNLCCVAELLEANVLCTAVSRAVV